MDKIKIINSLEKLRKTGFFHVIGSNVINKALLVVNNIIIVRLISKSDYGIYTYTLNIFSFFMLLSGLGFVSGVLQIASEYSKNEEKNLSVYMFGFKVGVLTNILLSVVIVLVSLNISLPIAGSNKLLLLMAFIPVFQIMIEFQKIYFRTQFQNKKFSYVNLISGFLIIFFSILGAYLYSIEGIIIGQYFGYFIVYIITIIYLGTPKILLNSHIYKSDRKALFKISILSMINNGFSTLLYLVGIFLIGFLIKEAQILAEYKVSLSIPMSLTFIPMSICLYVYPYFSLNKDNKKWVDKHFKLTLLVLAIINTFITLILIFFAPLIVKILFGKQYLNIVNFFRIASLSYFFIGTFRICAGNILVTQRKLKFNFVISLLSLILNFILNYILIKKIGVIGASYSTLIISAVTGLISTMYLFRIVKK